MTSSVRVTIQFFCHLHQPLLSKRNTVEQKKSTALRSSCKKIHSKGVVLNITLFFNSQLKGLLKHAFFCNSIYSQLKEPISFQRLLRIKDISLCQIVLNGQQRDIWWLVRRIKFQIFEVKGLSIRCFCHSP